MNAIVTVITPTKNRLKLLCEAIDSVQRQSFDAWEHIIVDDGSDDGTCEEVTRRMAADSRIRYLRRAGERSGANVCRNIGIAESSAEFIVFLDSDDLLRPHSLERRVETIRRNPSLDFCIFRAGVFVQTVGDLKRLYHPQNPGDDLLRFLTHECVWEISGPIWRVSFLREIGCFDETLLSMQDLELHVRALCARAKYVCFPDLDHDIRWQDDATKTSVRHFQNPTYIEAAEGVQRKLLKAVTSSGLLTWSRQRALLGLTFGVAESCVRATGLVDGMRIWNRGCSRQHAPMSLRVAGLLMLSAARQGVTPEGFCSRLVNKWKGWVRFRAEPLLMVERMQESSAKSPNDCAA
jgi:glycosyltransferase involved in cell wall biosynthesis